MQIVRTVHSLFNLYHLHLYLASKWNHGCEGILCMVTNWTEKIVHPCNQEANALAHIHIIYPTPAQKPALWLHKKSGHREVVIVWQVAKELLIPLKDSDLITIIQDCEPCPQFHPNLVPYNKGHIHKVNKTIKAKYVHGWNLLLGDSVIPIGGINPC